MTPMTCAAETQSRIEDDDLHQLARRYAARLRLAAKGDPPLTPAEQKLEEALYGDDEALPDPDDLPEEESSRRARIRRLKSDAVGGQEARRRLLARSAALAERLRLNEIEQELLLLAALKTVDQRLKNALSSYTARTLGLAADRLAAALDLPDGRPLRQALAGGGPLSTSGLLERPQFPCDLDDCLQPLPALVEAWFDDHPLDTTLLRSLLEPAPRPSRPPRDFAHLTTECGLLRAALSLPDRAGQVLIHGEPGTGKTELARFVVAQLRRHGYEIGGSADGEPAGRSERFRKYALITRLMAERSDTVLIFDEAEDVFTGDHWVHVTPSVDRHKAWTNRLLEGAGLPTIWLCNDIFNIDPAYLRRFDYVLQLKPPPRSVRVRLLNEALGARSLPAPLLERIADHAGFTPADAGRLARMLPAALRAGLTLEAAVTELLGCPPAAIPRQRLAAPRQAGLRYRLEWINADADLRGLIDGLRRRGCGTLVFSGVPGTGKSELARHIARRLDRPLAIHRASDLLDCYVGNTERNIAAAFAAAERDRSVLLLDEADSLLRDRHMAQQSWEVTQVNELLAQLDGYRGVAILTTNHADILDPALLRRIDFKLELRPLRPAQIPQAFAATLRALGLSARLSPRLRERLRGLTGLTIGDLVAVLNAFRLRPGVPQVVEVLDAAQAELRRKPEYRRPIGF